MQLSKNCLNGKQLNYYLISIGYKFYYKSGMNIALNFRKLSFLNQIENPKTEIEIQNTGRTGVSPVLKGEIN